MMKVVWKVVLTILKLIVVLFLCTIGAVIIKQIFFPNDLYHISTLTISLLSTTSVMLYPVFKKKKVTISPEDLPSNAEPIENSNLYFGYGGWLIFYSLTLGFQVLNNLKGIYDVWLLLNNEGISEFTSPDGDNYSPALYPTFIISMICQSLLVVGALVVAFLMIRMNKRFKQTAIIYISSTLGFQIIISILMAVVQSGLTVTMYTNETIFIPVISVLLYAIIWIPYMLVSKRVKNTFIMN